MLNDSFSNRFHILGAGLSYRRRTAFYPGTVGINILLIERKSRYRDISKIYGYLYKANLFTVTLFIVETKAANVLTFKRFIVLDVPVRNDCKFIKRIHSPVTSYKTSSNHRIFPVNFILRATRPITIFLVLLTHRGWILFDENRQI